MAGIERRDIRFGLENCLDGMISFNRDNGIKDVIIFLHGFMSDYKGKENKGRSKIYCENASEYGFIGLTFSFRGHGDSKGKRGYVSREQLIEDIGYAIDFVNKRLYGEVIGVDIEAETISLCGSSTGATGALHYVAQHPRKITSLALISPFTTLDNLALTEKQKEILGEYYKTYLKTRAEAYIPFERTDKPEEALTKLFPITSYHELNHLNGINIAKKISIPTLTLCGINDKWITPNSIRELHENLSSENKVLREYNDGHGLENHEKEVIEDIFDWFKKIIKKERKN